jgi:cation transport ATPase
VLFDKTGTLTMGQPVVLACVSSDDARLLWAAACCEASSEHPLAQAVLTAYRAVPGREPLLTAVEFESIEGEGLKCVLSNEVAVLVGNRRLLAHFNVLVPQHFEVEAAKQAAAARTVIFVAGEKSLKIPFLLFLYVCS